MQRSMSFVLTTVSTYESEAVVPASSVQVTVMVCVPTSALTGVPEIVVPEIVMVLGAPLRWCQAVPGIHAAHSGNAQAVCSVLIRAGVCYCRCNGRSVIDVGHGEHV